MLERVSALVQNQVSDYSKTYFNNRLFLFGGGGGGGVGTTCDMILHYLDKVDVHRTV